MNLHFPLYVSNMAVALSWISSNGCSNALSWISSNGCIQNPTLTSIILTYFEKPFWFEFVVARFEVTLLGLTTSSHNRTEQKFWWGWKIQEIFRDITDISERYSRGGINIFKYIHLWIKQQCRQPKDILSKLCYYNTRIQELDLFYICYNSQITSTKPCM